MKKCKREEEETFVCMPVPGALVQAWEFSSQLPKAGYEGYQSKARGPHKT
jgi:hypothetical protein